MKNKNLFYTDVFYPFAATKYKYKIRTSANVDLKSKIEYCIKNRNLFYTDVFYPFTATKNKYKIHTSANVDLKSKIEYCIKNHSFKIINMLLTN